MRQLTDTVFRRFTPGINQYLIVILVIALTAVVCKPLSNQQGYHIVSFILLFVVSIMAVILGIGPVLLASTLSALVWNFFFIPPHYAFRIEKTEDKLMFVSFFFIALLNGVLTNRIRRQERLALEREEKSRLLSESDKLYKTLFTLISHEFRIPIATIMGASDTLLLPQTSDLNKTELASEIFKASARLNHLVENLLNMSRLESGKISVHRDWCDINDILNKVTRVLKQELEQFHLVSIVPDDMPMVRLDFGLMEQVIYNLLLNSCQHTPPGSTIRFNSDFQDGRLIFVVEDNGPGFPSALLDRVFNKFFRVDNSRAGGLGLGLSIVKGLVEAHGGTVGVSNIQLGGARFSIKIPTEIPDMKKVKFEG